MIRILDISECGEALDTLIKWNDDYWSEKTPEVDLDEWIRFYQECVESRGMRIPVTLVGLHDERVFGAVSIVEVDDILDFPDYSPWIAGVIVGEEYRGQGLGLALMRGAEEKIRQLGLQKVYLWTNSRDEWYRAQGWIELHRQPFGRVEAVIMEKDF